MKKNNFYFLISFLLIVGLFTGCQKDSDIEIELNGVLNITTKVELTSCRIYDINYERYPIVKTTKITESFQMELMPGNYFVQLDTKDGYLNPIYFTVRSGLNTDINVPNTYSADVLYQ